MIPITSMASDRRKPSTSLVILYHRVRDWGASAVIGHRGIAGGSLTGADHRRRGDLLRTLG